MAEPPTPHECNQAEVLLYWMAANIPEAGRIIPTYLAQLADVTIMMQRASRARQVLQHLYARYPEWLIQYRVYQRLTSGRKI